MKIAALINRIETYADRLADEGVEIMKIECPVGLTGGLKSSIHKSGNGEWERTVGTDLLYARAVTHGRKAVYPKGNYYLKWIEYSGSQSSIHHGWSTGLVKAKHSSATSPNPFDTRTALKLRLKAKSLF